MIEVTVTVERPGEDKAEHKITWTEPLPENWAQLTGMMVTRILRNDWAARTDG